MQHPKWVHHGCPETTSVNRVKCFNTVCLCLLCRLGQLGHRQAWRLSSHLKHVFKSIKRVLLTPLLAFIHALYWTGKLTKDPKCIKESLFFYLQDKKYSFFKYASDEVGKTCTDSLKEKLWLHMDIIIWIEKTYAWTIVHRSRWCIMCLYMTVIKIFHTWHGG